MRRSGEKSRGSDSGARREEEEHGIEPHRILLFSTFKIVRATVIVITTLRKALTKINIII